MYRQVSNPEYPNGFTWPNHIDRDITTSGRLEVLVALESIGERLAFKRNDEIYAEGDSAEYWYKVVSGAVRISKLLADGRRHIGEFCFSGDFFGFDLRDERLYSAEAVDDVIVMRFSRKATERLADQNAGVARILRDTMLRDLANAHSRALLLGRMTAPERVASFLIEMFERRDRTKSVDLPMSRNDIADYLGLTIETVCRTLSAFKRDAVIAIPTPHRIELRDRDALEAIAETR